MQSLALQVPNVTVQQERKTRGLALQGLGLGYISQDQRPLAGHDGSSAPQPEETLPVVRRLPVQYLLLVASHVEPARRTTRPRPWPTPQPPQGLPAWNNGEVLLAHRKVFTHTVAPLRSLPSPVTIRLFKLQRGHRHRSSPRRLASITRAGKDKMRPRCRFFRSLIIQGTTSSGSITTSHINMDGTRRQRKYKNDADHSISRSPCGGRSLQHCSSLCLH